MSVQGIVFATPFGWWGLLGRDECVCRVTIGHRTQAAAWEALQREATIGKLARVNWHPKLKARLEQFAAGELVNFADFQVQTQHRTDFQQRVLAVTRAIPFGETVSYGELATMVNAPGAARAVGSVMASNAVPILIPCHRVVGCGGALGGFSAPSGIELKRRLLELERRAIDNRSRRSLRRRRR